MNLHTKMHQKLWRYLQTMNLVKWSSLGPEFFGSQCTTIIPHPF
uniref:Uncharacterized protein n=1 Tax=Nelumbo nucifera TaxID=4432 RepID=A0A822YHX5_NELNU|nr:TPA_asm: hypothetical protein HUJ06_012646 [Nelumbo nucifera]